MSGDIPDLYCIGDSFNGLEAEIVADQSFGEPLNEKAIALILM